MGKGRARQGLKGDVNGERHSQRKQKESHAPRISGWMWGKAARDSLLKETF